MHMSRVFSLLLCLCLVLTAVGCQTGGDTNASSSASSKAKSGTTSAASTVADASSVDVTSGDVTSANASEAVTGGSSITATSSKASSTKASSAKASSDKASSDKASSAKASSVKPSSTASVGSTEYKTTTYEVASNLDKFRVNGRTRTVTAYISNKQGMLYDHAGQGFFFNADCEGDITAQVEMQAKSEANKTYLHFSVRVDGVATDVTLDGSGSWRTLTLPIAKGLARGVHSVEIYRCNEAESGLVTLLSVTLTGAVKTYEAPAYDLKMVFLGDSITCGSGVDGSSSNSGKNILSDATRSYAFLCGKALGADFYIAGRSGSYAAKDTSPNSIYYTYDHVSRKRDATLYDNKAESDVDIYVISLGTNDNNKKNNAYIFTEQQVHDNIQALITRVRADHPNAKIVWTYGQLSLLRPNIVRGAVEEMMATDSKLYYYQYKHPNNQGGAWHPTAAAQEIDAQELTEFIRSNVL